jgi:hypothetical protein
MATLAMSFNNFCSITRLFIGTICTGETFEADLAERLANQFIKQKQILNDFEMGFLHSSAKARHLINLLVIF